jgi:hypothetical protein
LAIGTQVRPESSLGLPSQGRASQIAAVNVHTAPTAAASAYGSPTAATCERTSRASVKNPSKDAPSDARPSREPRLAHPYDPPTAGLPLTLAWPGRYRWALSVVAGIASRSLRLTPATGVQTRRTATRTVTTRAGGATASRGPLVNVTATLGATALTAGLLFDDPIQGSPARLGGGAVQRHDHDRAAVPRRLCRPAPRSCG